MSRDQVRIWGLAPNIARFVTGCHKIRAKAALCPKIELRDNPPTIPVARAGVPLSPVGNSDDDSRTQESRIAHGVNYPALHGKGCRRTIGFYSNDYLLVSSRALY